MRHKTIYKIYIITGYITIYKIIKQHKYKMVIHISYILLHTTLYLVSYSIPIYHITTSVLTNCTMYNIFLVTEITQIFSEIGAHEAVDDEVDWGVQDDQIASQAVQKESDNKHLLLEWQGRKTVIFVISNILIFY